MPFDSHFVVPDSSGGRLLLLSTVDGWRLPHWPLAERPPEREPGFPVAIRAWVQDHVGIDSVVLYWHNILAPVPRAARPEAEEPVRQTVYVLETLSEAVTVPAGGRWVTLAELGGLTLAEPHHRHVVEDWFEEANGGETPPSRHEWQRPGWFEDASRWIADRLCIRGTPVASSVTQWHNKGGCALLRVRTASGGAYFKALPAMYAREPMVTRRLATLRPKHIAEVLAVDADRRWLLTVECAGEWLPDVTDIRVWEDVLRAMASVQIACVGMVDELLGLGCPDLRLSRLPMLLDELLSDGTPALLSNSAAPSPWARVSVTPAELEDLRSLAPRLLAARTALACFGIPETLEHGDFHAGQVIVGGRRPVLIDWADCAVSHPFFSLARFLTNAFRPNAPREPHAVTREPAAYERLRDAYLEPWSAYATIERLRAAFVLAQPLAALEHALNCYQLDFTRRGIPWERSAGVAMFIRLLLAQKDDLPVAMRDAELEEIALGNGAAVA